MPTTLARDAIWCLLIAWIAIISYLILIGGINMAGMLYAKGRHRDYSPARVQLLVVTLAGAFYVLFQVFGGPSPHAFPRFSPALLGVLGASHLTYLASKAYTLLVRR